MEVKIHNTELNDSVIIEAETISELTNIGMSELEKRGWKKEDCWSEKLSD